MVVESLTLALRHAFHIAGAAFDGAQVLQVVRRVEADCLLLEIMLPGTNGLELIPQIRELQPHPTIIVVTMLSDRVAAEAALHAGASGFVTKHAGVDELTFAIREALAGRSYLSSRVPKTTHRVGVHASHPALQRLTPRQQQIVLLLGEVKSESEIARALGLSLSTIIFHKHNLMHVLGIETNAALIRFSVLLRAGVQTAKPDAGT